MARQEVGRSDRGLIMDSGLEVVVRGPSGPTKMQWPSQSVDDLTRKPWWKADRRWWVASRPKYGGRPRNWMSRLGYTQQTHVLEQHWVYLSLFLPKAQLYIVVDYVHTNKKSCLVHRKITLILGEQSNTNILSNLTILYPANPYICWSRFECICGYFAQKHNCISL